MSSQTYEAAIETDELRFRPTVGRVVLLFNRQKWVTTSVCLYQWAKATRGLRDAHG